MIWKILKHPTLPTLKQNESHYSFRIEPATNKAIPSNEATTLMCEATSAPDSGGGKDSKKGEPVVQKEGSVILVADEDLTFEIVESLSMDWC